MHERQWFSRQSQYGLETCAQNFEDCLRLKQYEKCYAILSECLQDHPSYWQRQYKRLSHLYRRSTIQEASKTKLPIHIAWSSFWPSFNPNDNQILDFLRSSRPDLSFRSVPNASQADLLISSCYPGVASMKEVFHSTHILFLGENVRPRYDLYDYSYTFDISPYGLRNVYMPLWLFELDWFERGFRYPDREVFPLSVFTQERCISLRMRKPCVVYVGNNCEPFRHATLQLLSSSLDISVDLYGSHTSPVEDKISLVEQYRLALAFENSYYPGYVTEKGIHSYLSATPTLYWGSKFKSPFSTSSLFTYIDTAMNEDALLSLARQMCSSIDNIVIDPLFQRSYLDSLCKSLLERIAASLAVF
jgi:hypothetical protein